MSMQSIMRTDNTIFAVMTTFSVALCMHYHFSSSLPTSSKVPFSVSPPPGFSHAMHLLRQRNGLVKLCPKVRQLNKTYVHVHHTLCDCVGYVLCMRHKLSYRDLCFTLTMAPPNDVAFFIPPKLKRFISQRRLPK